MQITLQYYWSRIPYKGANNEFYWICFRPEVLNSSPRSAYFACLSLLTHLIQIISLLEVRSMHELCSDWHAPYTGSIAPYTGSIAPYSLSRGNPLKFTLFRDIHSWICATQRLHARTSVTSYTSVNIYNFNSCLAHFNALWMEYIRSLRTGIMEECPVMCTSQGTCVRIEQTSEAIRVTYEICRAGVGGVRTGIENRCFRLITQQAEGWGDIFNKYLKLQYNS